MNMPLLAAVVACVFVLYSIINAAGNDEHPVRKSFLEILTGFSALIAVNLLSPFTNAAIPVSVVSVIAAAAGGIPGVTLMLALNAFF